MGVREDMGVSLHDMLGLCSLGFDQHLDLEANARLGISKP
jgi:hypothetical protein